MFRLLFLLVLLGAAFLLVETRWEANTRTLSLRVRTAAELVKGVQATARTLGGKAAERVAGVGSEPPPVSTAPPERAAEQFSAAERAKLDRLVEEKTRAP
ncbi:MAG: hypothetical protein FJ108_02455 [Deltaproteobacteria bacterium]|nr:hypothetical protein [Deltaproteobacteria bacterium]